MGNKKILIVILNLFILFALIPYEIYNCKVNFNDGKKILVIASYSINNNWETSVIDGLQNSAKKEHSIKVEFLDSKVLSSEEYDSSFINLLNLKYYNNIDYIITLDDEAFQLVRSNLFNEELFTYKKPIIFAGVNNNISLTNEESEYITGIIEYQDNLPMVNIMLTAGKKIDNIYLLLDNSIYSYTISENIKNSIEFAEKPYNVNVVRSVYFEDILEEVKKIDYKNSAILLGCTYKNIENNENIKPEVLISNIKKLTKAPIYTTLEEYVEAGAIGGIVNDGYKLGTLINNILESIIARNNIYNIVPPHDTFSVPVFNFKSIREYNINPLRLPKDTVYINKKFYNILLPKYMIIIIYSLIALFITGIVVLIYSLVINRKRMKKNNLLLIESIEREKVKTDFIVTIYHELRTPLNIIINATNLLKINVKQNKYDKMFFLEKLDYIMKNSNRLRKYINNLIDVNRLEMGYVDAQFKNENIVEVVEDVTLNIVDLARKYNIQVIFDTDEEEIITAIDKIKIERVILNLLSNAIKFTNDGGTILVSVERKESSIIIKIKDNGIGVSEENKNHIFEKFKRADFNEGFIRQNEGSGLGLFIVKGLITLHKGSIQLESELNKGTTVIITLPLRTVEVSEKEDSIVGNSLDYMVQMEFSDLDKK